MRRNPFGIRLAATAALILLLATFAQAQTSQFLFDDNGNLLVQAANINAPPQITRQPLNRTVGPGETASFFVVAADTLALAYQWRFNGVPLGGSGATDDALLLQNVSTNNQGQYSVVLTNPSGSVTSAPALLTIDSDGDGMGDSWELTYFPDLDQNASRDFDFDGSSNLEEFRNGTDPTDRNSYAFRLVVVRDAGTVIKTPDRLMYTNGQTVTLTAIPPTNGTFHAWLGSIVTRSNPVTLVMNSDKTVYARFTPIIFTWTSPASGDWDVAANWTPRLAPNSNDTAIITTSVTVTLNSSADCADVTLGDADSNPTLTGNGTLTVRGALAWASGAMSGNGRTILESNASLTLDSATQLFLDTRTLELGGQASWTTPAPLALKNAVITNRPGALLDIQRSASVTDFFGASRIDNAGTFRKSLHGGTTTFGSGVRFNNYGAVETETGTLNFAGGGTHSGSFDVPAGTALILSGGTHIGIGSSSITGAGHLTFSGGAVNLAGLVNVSGSNTFTSVNLLIPGTMNFTGTYICTNNTLTIAGNNTVNFSGMGLLSPAVLELKELGVLTGTSTVTVLNAMNWTGGAMSGSGRTIIPAGVTLNVANPSIISLSSRTLENGGTVLWTGGGIFGAISGAVITNRAGALFHVQSAAGLGGGGANGRFDNAGTFRKSVNSGTTAFASGMSLNNSGIVEIQTGTLNLGGGGTHSGSFDVPAGTALILSSGTHIGIGSSSITGAGHLTFSGGAATLAGLINVSGSNTFSGGTATFTGNTICTNNTVTISGNPTVNFSGTGLVSPAVLDLSGGTLTGTSTVTVLNAMNWTGGTMSGSGRTIIAAGGTLNAANPSIISLSSRTLESGGTVLWTGGGIFSVISGAVITNRAGALFHVQSAAGLGGGGANGRFDNAGTFRKSANTGTTTVQSGMNFNNSGTVDIRSGILAANGGYISSPNALLNCALGGTMPGTGFGQLQVAGTVTLIGGLSVDLINGFVPTTNDTFTVLTAGTRIGTFASFSHPSNAATMLLSNTANSVIVRVTDVFSVPQPAPVPAGLISWWRAEGNALDSIGTNHGVLTNGAGFATGQVGQTFALDGVNDYVNVLDSASLKPASVTMETWVKFFVTNGIGVIIGKPLGNGVFNSYALALRDGAVLGLICDTNGFGPILTGPTNTVTGQWYHLAYTFDNISKQQVLYVNGIPVASGTANKAVSYDAQPVLLGADVENGVLSFFHHGQIDEASLYNRALTSDEIATLFNAGTAGKQLPLLTPYQQWKQTYLGDANAPDSGDPDGDGFSNRSEFTADTNPTNAVSNLRITGVTFVPAGIAFEWQGGTLATQYLQCAFGLGAAASWTDVFTNLPPTASPSGFTNSPTTNATQFYRLRVLR